MILALSNIASTSTAPGALIATGQSPTASNGSAASAGPRCLPVFASNFPGSVLPDFRCGGFPVASGLVLPDREPSRSRAPAWPPTAAFPLFAGGGPLRWPDWKSGTRRCWSGPSRQPAARAIADRFLAASLLQQPFLQAFGRVAIHPMVQHAAFFGAVRPLLLGCRPFTRWILCLRHDGCRHENREGNREHLGSLH